MVPDDSLRLEGSQRGRRALRLRRPWRGRQPLCSQVPHPEFVEGDLGRRGRSSRVHRGDLGYRERADERKRARPLRPWRGEPQWAHHSADHPEARRRRRRAHHDRHCRSLGRRRRSRAGGLRRRAYGERAAGGGRRAHPVSRGEQNPIAMFFNIRKLARLIYHERIDLVHARSRAPAWVALHASHITERPFVTTYHGAYRGHSTLKLSYNSVMAKGDVVIANSRYTAALIERLYPFARDRLARHSVAARICRVFAPGERSIGARVARAARGVGRRAARARRAGRRALHGSGRARKCWSKRRI